MKILNTAAAFLIVITITGSVHVHADEIISKEDAVSLIWEDEWNGHDDDGTVWPEASYNYHLLESWVDENYGNPDYNWSDPGQLEYSYSHWYRNLTENWKYFDDEEGGWFITDGNTGDKYHFEFRDGTWYMLNETGEIHDTFGPHSTIDEDDSYKAEPAVPDDEDNTGKVIPENQEAAHQKASEWFENKSGIQVLKMRHRQQKCQQMNIEVHKRGVDIITELDEAAESLPIMHSDDYCICCGFYGNIAESGDAVYSQYHKLRCPECVLLDEYCLYRENKSEDYRIITRDECKEIKKSKYKKRKNLMI